MNASIPPALRGLLEKSEKTLSRADAFFDLFILESALHLLARMGEKKDAEECVSLFEEFLLECDPQKQHRDMLTCKIALQICKLALEKGVNLPIFHIETLPFPTDLCYVKSRFTESLLPLLEDEAAIYYAEDFEEACLLTSEGKRQGCLLPYMGADRLPLQGISRLIDEYDLKKCRLFHIDDGQQDTFYLLLSSTLRPHDSADRLEVAAATSRKRLDALLSLTDRCGLICNLPAPLRGISDPAPEEKTHFCRFTLTGARTDLRLFYGVLRLCLPESTLCGFYDCAELME